ncbi:MAG: M23 family metallopeptidase [Candidatus Gracilibacteria bacterium]|nr:M23 family metallopeptidase [Candidatus Gracilibacteria bacterium]
MNKKLVSFWILIVSFFSIGFGYSLVFAGNLGEIEFKLSNNLFIDSLNLNKNRVIIKSRENLENVVISGDCGINGKFVQKGGNSYIFDVFLLDKNCDKKKINIFFIKDGLEIQTSFNLTKNVELYSKYIDYSNERLNLYLSSLDQAIKLLEPFSSYNKNLHLDKYNYLSKNRNLSELQYMHNFISDILKKREQKYFIPLKGVNLTTISSKLPNSARPYRSEYTDGVHEGWDFDGDFGETVVSLDYGIVVRIVNDFTFSDLDKIKMGNNLTKNDKVKNLDILRGNQVWIKTMKGDVAFYSHLDKVYSNIKVGDMVFRGQALGNIGISGVPDKNYTDYHLHMELRKNPYNDIRKIPYSIDEYMSWDWYFKGENEKYILENQYNIFQKND